MAGASPAERRTLEVRLLGQLAVRVDGAEFRLTTPRKTLQVLAYLLLHRTAPVSRDHLAFLVWPDEEETVARARLRSTINDLLHVLPQPAADFITADTNALSWNAGVDLWLDVEAFVDASKDEARLDEAVDHYRGDLLPQLYDEWIYGIRERLRNLYLTDLARLVGEARKRGDLTRAIEIARRILELDPWREDIVRRVISLRYEAGDAAGALSEYRQFAVRLREEMGVDPMPETAAVAERVVARDDLGDDEGALDIAVSRPTERETPLPFAGRDREMERITEAWNRAKQRRGGVVFIGGEPGIGKSRLVREFMHAVEEGGARALYGATGTPEAFPYQCLVEALRAQLPLVTALEIGPTWMAALAGLLPELPQRLGPLPDLPTLGADEQRLRLFEALTRAIVELARPRPLLVVLEDVHWASQATFDALTFLTRRASGSRVLFLVTFRDDEVLAQHPLRRMQRNAELERSATSISVQRLDADVVARMIEDVGATFDGPLPAFAAAMHERSAGNPLFLTHLLAAPRSGDEVPPTIASLVQARFAGLSAPAQAVAEIAALAGQRFSAEVVRDVAGFGDAEGSIALDELLDTRIVQETTGRGMLPYAFSHQLVQQAIAQLADPSRFQERSRRMARALQQHYPERAREFAWQIARHLEAAQRRDDASAQYAVAAQYALDVGALDDARRHIGRALALTEDRTATANLLRLRQRINERGAHSAAERKDLAALWAIADVLDDEDLRCTVLMRRARLAFDDYRGSDEATAPIAELRERARRSGNLRWQARADLTESMFYALGLNAGHVVRMAERALETYRAIGDDVGVARALASLARLLFLSGDVERSVRASEEALAAAEACGDYEAATRAAINASVNAQDLLDLASAEKWNARWLELAVKAGDRRGEAEALGQTAWPLMWRPTFLSALPILEQAAEICREWNLAPALAVVEMNVAEVGLKAGRPERAAATFERVASAFASGAPFFSATARCGSIVPLALSGRAQRAVTVGHAVVAQLEASGNVVARASAFHNLAEAEYLAGNVAAAIDHLERAIALHQNTSIRRTASHHGALLAAFYAETGQGERALLHARQVPTSEPLRSVELNWPQRSQWCAAFAFHRCGDAAAAKAALQRAVSLYQAHLPHLNDDQRATFAALPWHRALLAAEAGDWPMRAW